MAKEKGFAEEATAPVDDQAALLAELKAENEKLRNAIKLDGGGKLPIRGTFKATVVRNGETVEKTFKFTDGHANIRLKDIGIVPTEEVMQLASGKSLAPETVATYPGLKALVTPEGKSNGKAEQHLQRLADIGYGYLREV